MSIREVPSYSGVPNQARPPKMVISSLLDATEPNLEPLVVRTLDDFSQAQAAAGPDLLISADLFRAGSTRGQKNRQHFINSAMNVAIGVASGLSSLFGIEPIGIETAGFHFQSKYGESEPQTESRIAHNTLPFSDWKGHRKFVIDGSGLSQASSDGSVQPSAAELRENLAANMTQWNSATHVVHVFGHGNGIRGMASLQPSEVGKALVEAKEKSGREADVLLLESCMMGNVEALHHLSGGGQVAVASERPLEFPIKAGQSEQHLLGPQGYAKVAQEGGTAREVASNFLRAAGEQRFQQETLASFDLKAVSGNLVPSLDVLGTHLQQEPESARLINDCLEKTTVVSADDGLLDLGGFLSQLRQHQHSFQPATREALNRAHEALQGSVLEYHGSPGALKQGLTGISFLDPRVSFLANGKPVEFSSGMPAGWVGLGPVLNKELQERPPTT